MNLKVNLTTNFFLFCALYQVSRVSGNIFEFNSWYDTRYLIDFAKDGNIGIFGSKLFGYVLIFLFKVEQYFPMNTTFQMAFYFNILPSIYLLGQIPKYYKSYYLILVVLTILFFANNLDREIWVIASMWFFVMQPTKKSLKALLCLALIISLRPDLILVLPPMLSLIFLVRSITNKSYNQFILSSFLIIYIISIFALLELFFALPTEVFSRHETTADSRIPQSEFFFTQVLINIMFANFLWLAPVITLKGFWAKMVWLMYVILMLRIFTKRNRPNFDILGMALMWSYFLISMVSLNVRHMLIFSVIVLALSIIGKQNEHSITS